ETMETIAVLEGRATALSAPLLTAEDLNEARRINQQMRDLLNNFDPLEFTHLNKEFHQTLLASARILGWCNCFSMNGRTSNISAFPLSAMCHTEQSNRWKNTTD